MTAADARCDLTDLLPSECGCRLHRGGQTPDEEAVRDRRPGLWFPARYPGTCTRCGVGFEDNQDIRADGFGGWECCDD
jgi:hypothetical protein